MKINKRYILISITLLFFAWLLWEFKNQSISTIVGLILWLMITVQAINLIFKPQKYLQLFKLIVLLILRLINANTLISSAIFLIMIGSYQLFLGLIYFITFIIYFRNKEKGKYRYLFDAWVLISLGIQTIFNPISHLNGQFLIVSIYLLFLAFRYLRDGIFYESYTTASLKRRVRFHVPIFLEVFLPGGSLQKINHLLSDDNNTVLKNIDDYNSGFEIYVHAQTGFKGATGHVDICVDNTVISYGCYDKLTERFFGSISDGTLIKCDREAYLNFCKETKDYIWGYKIKITPQQKQLILDKIEKINDILIPWELDVVKHQELNTQAYQLSLSTNTQFYKFSKSKYKTYFLATTNCSAFADEIIGSIGTDILNIRGLITPGTYKNYLDEELKKENGFVVECNMY